jgi:pimeloyl-ACP methyl ester carboxylesterase
VERAGDNDPVVLLHGQPGSGKEWRRVIDALGPSVVALAPDRPGYGNNPLPAGGLAANVRWLGRHLDGGPGPALIVGHSWAGSVALSLALARPELTRGLVLVGSVGPGAITWVDRALAHPAVGSVADRWGARVGRRPARRAPAALLAFLTEQTSLVRDLPAVLDALERITTPATVIAGTRDRVVPPATARRLAERLPNAELVSVAGGHQLHRTHPRLVAGVIRRALAQSTPR